MAKKKPLVITSGQIQELSTADTILDRYSAEKNTNQAATGSYATYLTTTFASMVAGTYELTFFMKMSTTKPLLTNVEFNVRCKVDGVQLENGGAAYGQNGSYGQDFFRRRDVVLTAGSHTFLIEFQMTLGGTVTGEYGFISALKV